MNDVSHSLHDQKPSPTSLACGEPAPVQLRCLLPEGHDGPHSLGDSDEAAVADLRGLFAELVQAWGPYEICTHAERRNGCWGLLPWDEEGWLVPDPCNWCRHAHVYVEGLPDAI